MTQAPQITLVAALDEHRVIGHRGDLPWRLPADLKHFKRITMGHPLVMGRKTHESIGKPLPGRENIVLTRNRDYTAAGCTIAHSLDAAITHAANAGSGQVMVIGGASIFRRALPRATRMHLTVVAGRYDGDTFFPSFNSEQWRVVSSKQHPADDSNEAAMTFVQLQAVADPPLEVGDAAGPGELPAVLSDHVRARGPG